MSELQNRQIHIVGGGTIEPVRSHLELSAYSAGTTAKKLGELCAQHMPAMDINLHLTRTADIASNLQSVADLEHLAQDIADDMDSKVVFWSPIVADFTGKIGNIPSSKHGQRLSSRSDETQTIDLTPTPKIVPIFRKRPNTLGIVRKDMFAVGFKTTTGATPQEQFFAGLKLLKDNSLNLVLANDPVTRNNMIVAPEEAAYSETKERDVILEALVKMVYYRTQLSFTRSEVVAGEPVPWESEAVFPNLRTVVNYCIKRGAYRDRNWGYTGPTAGHFAAKLDDRTFLTSRRKTNFNNLDEVGLVRVETNGDDHVIAYGSKPSVGGQSQRIIFEQHPDKNAIVHFHCALKPGSKVPVVSQAEYECGSHQCGQNTSSGLGVFAEGEIEAVYLGNPKDPYNPTASHGPNVIFSDKTDPQKIIKFMEENFDLTTKTGMRPVSV